MRSRRFCSSVNIGPSSWTWSFFTLCLASSLRRPEPISAYMRGAMKYDAWDCFVLSICLTICTVQRSSTGRTWLSRLHLTPQTSNMTMKSSLRRNGFSKRSSMRMRGGASTTLSFSQTMLENSKVWLAVMATPAQSIYLRYPRSMTLKKFSRSCTGAHSK